MTSDGTDTFDNTATTSVFAQTVVSAINELVAASTTDELAETRALLLRRLALLGDVAPARIPVPENITVVGGWLNLVERYGGEGMMKSVVASAVGVATPELVASSLAARAPALFFVARDNDRAGEPEEQARYPLVFDVRSDFVSMFDAARAKLRARGAAVPFASTRPARLVRPGGTAPPPGHLDVIGRALDVSPEALLGDPDRDPVLVARKEAEPAGSERLVARVLDAAAPSAPDPVAEAETWVVSVLAGDGTLETVDRTEALVEVEPLLLAAGWLRPGPLDEPTLLDPARRGRLINIAGLVTGLTTLRDELSLLFSAREIGDSVYAASAAAVWDGSAFVAA